MKFEKKLELEINVKKYRRESDMHVFTIEFSKNISGGYDSITELDISVFLVTDDMWFKSDNCVNPNNGFELDIFEEGDYHFLKTLFDSEENFYKIIQDLCIQYCKDCKLPDCYMLLGNDEDENTSFTYDILDEYDAIESKGELILNSIYYSNDKFKTTKFVLDNNELLLENQFVTMRFKRDESESIYTFVNKCTIEFITKFNNEIMGNYDWDKL